MDATAQAAQSAYETYVAQVGGRSESGLTLPGWPSLAPLYQDAWQQALRVGAATPPQEGGPEAVQAAYGVYRDLVGGRSESGTVVPAWEELHLSYQDAWRMAMQVAMQVLGAGMASLTAPAPPEVPAPPTEPPTEPPPEPDDDPDQAQTMRAARKHARS